MDHSILENNMAEGVVFDIGALVRHLQLIPSRWHSSATDISTRNPSRILRIFSSPEYFLRVLRRMLRTVSSAVETFF